MADPIHTDSWKSLFTFDAEPELVFDAIARFAAELCRTPMALIDLVEEERRWFKPGCGRFGLTEHAPELAFFRECALDAQWLEVPDTEADPRFAGLEQPADAPVRFYAGMPITLAEGQLLGTLSVLDREPRQLAPEQHKALQALAAIVAGILEKRHQQYAEEVGLFGGDGHPLDVMLGGMKSMVALWGADFRIRFANREFADWFGTSAEQLAGLHLAEVIGASAYRDSRPYIEQALAGRVQVFEHELPGLDEQSRPVTLRFIPFQNEAGAIDGFFSVVAVVSETEPEDINAESDENYRRMLETSQKGIWFFDPEARSFTFDELSRAHYGVSEAAIPAERMVAITHPDDRARIRQLWAAFGARVEGGSDHRFELRVRHPSGRYVWLDVAARLHRGAGDDSGEVVLITGTSRDISEQKRLQETLRREHERLRAALESIGDAVITTDRSGRIQYLNPVAEMLSGIRHSEALGVPLESAFAAGGRQRGLRLNRELVRRCVREDRMLTFNEPLQLRGGASGEAWVQCSLSPVRDSLGKTVGTVIILRDVSEQRRQAEQAQYDSSHDPVTGLINRREFERGLRNLVERTQKTGGEHALLVIDLDHFKLLNQTCGRHIGDQVLREISRLIEQCIRGDDTLSRFGGDEFALILQRCGLEAATVVARKICTRVDEYVFLHEDQNLRLGASIGLTMLDQDCKGVTDLLKEADSACYVAQKAGGGRVQAYIERDARMKRHNTVVNWASRLVTALDQGGFELFAQRISPLAAGGEEALHCEVLLRLRDERGQLAGPGVFMPAAERYHIASRIDRWVVKKVFDVLDKPELNASKLGMVSINLSGQSLGDLEFHRYVEYLLAATRVDLRKICFEVTETSAVANLEEARQFIERMRSHGIHFALDDFGSGFSSFAYLRQLPVDFIKIDGQFVRNMVADPVDALTVKSIAEIGRALGCTTIAEFVETEEVRQALMALRVDMGQGYLLHRPEPLLDILQCEQAVAV